MSVVEVRVPDLGDSKGVKVVEVLVAKGAEIRLDDPLITLETEKASMDVPSPVAGVIESIDIKKGDDVVAGTLIATVTVADAAAAPGQGDRARRHHRAGAVRPRAAPDPIKSRAEPRCAACSAQSPQRSSSTAS
jgi:pyruvate/2-oxoglutarate dehydrogenase complex dihydrolipoamide acyltransferase (E2) component